MLFVLPMLLILARMVSCSAMAATQTITSSEPAADSAPGGLAQYTASVTRLMQISVDLGGDGRILELSAVNGEQHFHS